VTLSILPSLELRDADLEYDAIGPFPSIAFLLIHPRTTSSLIHSLLQMRKFSSIARTMSQQRVRTISHVNASTEPDLTEYVTDQLQGRG
jgi:hypothetical protein